MGSLWNLRNVEAGPTTLVRGTGHLVVTWGTGHLVLTYLRDTGKVVLRVKLPPATPWRSTVSAEGQVSSLGDADRQGARRKRPVRFLSSFPLVFFRWSYGQSAVGRQVLLLDRILVWVIPSQHTYHEFCTLFLGFTHFSHSLEESAVTSQMQPCLFCCHNLL